MAEKKNNILNSNFIDYELISLSPTLDKVKKVLSNPKPLLIVLEEEENKKENLELLKKILGAAKFNFEQDVQILLLDNKDKMRLSDIRSAKEIKYIFLFGLTSSQIGLNISLSKYHLITFNDVGFLQSDSLTLLSSNSQFKGMLWNCLKQNFLS